MTIFLYGSDGYRLKENIDTIVGTYRKKHENSISYYRFDLDGESKFDDLAGAVKSVSFFDEVKLIVIKNQFSCDDQATIDRLGKLMREFKVDEDKKIVLVFVENKSENELRKVNKELLALLRGKNNLVRSFEYLSGVKLFNWVINKFKENGYSISPVVADLLIKVVSNESWALANEISKLSNYLTGQTCYNRSGLLTKEDVGLLVSYKENNSIFDLIDAVGNRNKAKAFEMMYRLINSGHDSHYLLSMLVYHFENLLSVSDLLSRSPASGTSGKQDIAKRCGLHPFVAQKAISQAQKFKKEDLLKKFSQLAGLDVASKNGQADLEDSLYNFLFL